MPFIVGDLPPTPTPSFHSPSRRVSASNFHNFGALPVGTDKMRNDAQPVTGPSSGFRPIPRAVPERDLPPTPPVNDVESSVNLSNNASDSTPMSSGLSFVEPSVPQRKRRGRRPPSVYPSPGEEPMYQTQRKYTDPTPRTHRYTEDEAEEPTDSQQLDVDLDAYSTTGFEEEDGLEDREPTLSFVTTSTVESVTSTPSMGKSYGFQTETVGGKPELGPRIRMRTTAGRSNAYSSAESSMASGASSYHAYPENHVYYPHPPPLPVVPNAYALAAEQVGLGITGHHLIISSRRSDPQLSSPNSHPPLSPSTSFVHRPWRRDVVNRLRSDSAASSVTIASVSTSDTAPSASGISASDRAVPYPYDSYQYSDRLPWEQDDSPVERQSEAIAMVDEGRGKILEIEKLNDMGGLESLTEESIGSLTGITHLLLPSCGSSLIPVLPTLLVVLSPSLVVLDLSSNDLSFIPAALQRCTALEELNLSGNPLRHLPAWVGGLVSLRMLVVDGCELQNVPQEVSQLTSLHTLCARRNRLVSLPSWLCLLGHLETLRVDDNPFAKEWLPSVAPILANPPRCFGVPSIPPGSTAQAQINAGSSLRSAPSIASMASSRTASSIQSRDIVPSVSGVSLSSEDTWMSPSISTQQSMYPSSGLVPIAEDHPHPAHSHGPYEKNTATPAEPHITNVGTAPDMLQHPGLRRMRSAGPSLDQEMSLSTGLVTEPTRANVSDEFALRGTNGIGDASDIVGSAAMTPSSSTRFGSQGSSSGVRAASAMSNFAHGAEPSSNHPNRLNAPRMLASASTKSGKWGFLRKMSMNKLKADKGPSLTASASANLKLMPPPLNHTSSDPVPLLTPRPGVTSTRSAMTLPTRKAMGSDVSEFGQPMTKLPSSASTMPIASLPSANLIHSSASRSSMIRGKRRSFLPVDGPPSINISIPSMSPFMPSSGMFEHREPLPPARSEDTIEDLTMIASSSGTLVESPSSILEPELRYAAGLESIKLYLRDLFDLSRPPIEPYGGFEVVGGPEVGHAMSAAQQERPFSPVSASDTARSISESRRTRRPTFETSMVRKESSTSVTDSKRSSMAESGETSSSGKKFKNDRGKRAKVIREIYETERTYVRGLGELVAIYVKPASQLVNPGKAQTETVVPAAERKIVFGGIESILTIHRDNLLPALERVIRHVLEGQDDEEGALSSKTAHDVGDVFRTYIAYMKQYSAYINNFDNALSRMKTWTAPISSPVMLAFPTKPTSPNITIASAAVSVGMGMSTVSMPINECAPQSGSSMTTSQRKRVKAFLKRCREHPMHSQINLESYLLLPIQRVPRYKLLLEDLAMCTSSQEDRPRDTLDDALSEIASLASLMNEEKRDSDSRLRLFHWQKRICGRGPSPLVQPHRKLIMDGALNLIRLVKKASIFVETDATPSIDAEQTITPAKVVVPVDYIASEPMDRPMMLILCSDLLVLVQQRGEGWDGQVDLFNVLRMATLRDPASIVHGNVLRVVDNKSIYYFNGGSLSSSTQWCRAINSARRR